MTPVKSTLSGRRYALPVTGNHGEKKHIYIDNAVKGRLHIIAGTESFWIDNTIQFLGILNELLKEENNLGTDS